jgi:hypothetical protein
MVSDMAPRSDESTAPAPAAAARTESSRFGAAPKNDGLLVPAPIEMGVSELKSLTL